MSSTPYYIGIDLGGTQLRMAAVTPTGQLATEMLSVPTGKGFAPPDLLRELSHLSAQILELTGGHPIAGWGVGAAVGFGAGLAPPRKASTSFFVTRPSAPVP